MGKITLQNLTRKTSFVYDDGHKMTWQEMEASAMLRIAEALETIAENSKITAQNIPQLMSDRDYYKSRANRLSDEINHLKRSNSALRGVVTRTKNKSETGANHD